MVKRGYWTDEQNKLYNSLPELQRKYVDARIEGYNKADSARRAGYKKSNPTAQGNMIERRNPMIKEMIRAALDARKVQSFAKNPENSAIGERIDALAIQNKNADIIKRVESLSPDMAERVKFYKDIVEGKIRSVKRTVFRNKNNEVTSSKEEYTSDISIRMKARQELDRLLGLGTMPTVGEVVTGSNNTINILIVDSSIKETEEQKAEHDKEYEDLKSKVEIVGEEQSFDDNSADNTANIIMEEKPDPPEKGLDEEQDAFFKEVL